MVKFRVFVLAFLFLSGCVPLVQAQSQEAYIPRPALRRASLPACGEVPREDADPRLCVPASDAEQDPELSSALPVRIGLQISGDTPLRIALDQRTRVRHPGEVVHGRVVEAVYAFDQSVIPAGSTVTGHVTNVVPVSGAKRTLAYSNGNFSPFHKYDLTFDSLTLPDGRQIPINTTVTPGTARSSSCTAGSLSRPCTSVRAPHLARRG